MLSADLKRVYLLEAFDPDAELVVLVLLSGGFKTRPTEPFRGDLWCEDSFDDLAVQRAMVAEFSSLPVQFLAVAFPPVFSTGRYGYLEEVFLNRAENSGEYLQAVRDFVEATGNQTTSSLLPFTPVRMNDRRSW